MRPTRIRDTKMKTVSKFLATIMLLISSSAVFAQIELLHSVAFSGEEADCENSMFFSNSTNCYSGKDWNDFIAITDISGYTGYYMLYFDKELNKIVMKTFSSDFSETTKTFSVPNIDGYSIKRDVLMSQHYFNNDDEFEFICTYKVNNANYDDNYEKLIAFDSKGNILKDFGSAQYFRFIDYLFIVNNKATICIYKELSDKKAFEIYSVPTTVNPNQLKSATISNSTLSAFPNPAKTFVNLSYNVSGVEDAEMVITDASGRVVERRIVNAMQDNLRLNVANYKRGMYFYEVQGFTGRFIVE